MIYRFEHRRAAGQISTDGEKKKTSLSPVNTSVTSITVPAAIFRKCLNVEANGYGLNVGIHHRLIHGAGGIAGIYGIRNVAQEQFVIRTFFETYNVLIDFITGITERCRSGYWQALLLSG